MADIHAERRERLLARLGGGVLVLPGAREWRRNGDSEFAFRQESDVLWLTGYREADAVLVLAPRQAKPFTMFVRGRDPKQETWTGRRAGVEGAVARFGANQAFPIEQFEKELPRLLVGAHAVYAPLGLDPEFDARLVRMLTELRAKTRTGALVPTRIEDPAALIHELRLFKSGPEIERLETAAELTARGHLKAMETARAGQHEYEVEAELLYAYRKGGGDGPGYQPIVAAGVNGTILHYRTGRDVLNAGELLLIDSGCEFDGYTADVTRTFPIDATFTRAQQALYELVLEANVAAIDAVRPGTSREAVHELACRVLIRGLVRLGLLKGDEDALWKDKGDDSYRRYYMHGTSHWLGLDVHDPGAYHQGGVPRPLAPGIVLTVEPGLYIAPDDERAPPEFRGIGIRIEDDVLVTEDGHRNLTAAVPKSVDDVLRLRR